MEKIGPDHYRYHETLNPDGVNVECRTYIVIAETPACYWVIDKSYAGYVGQDYSFAKDMVKSHRKLVLKSKGWRRFCYPDRKEALESLRHRKRRQLLHLERHTSMANLAIKGIDEALASGAELGDELKCGQDSYTESLNWGDY